MFSRRAGWDLAPNELSSAIAVRRADGRTLLDLTESNPTRCGLDAGGRALARAFVRVSNDPRLLRYEPDACGDVTARVAVADYHATRGPAPDPGAVVLTAGTSEAYAHLFRLLGDPGDRVLVPSPSYPLFGLLAALEGLEVAPYPLRFRDGRWHVDLDALRREAADPRVRALLVVHPNNPTGSLVDADEASALRSLCCERGIALVSDEVFADSRSHTASAVAPATLLGDGTTEEPLTFVLSGASKVLALPQLKVAWIVASGPRVLRDEAMARLEVIADGFLSVSGASQLVLPELLAARAGIADEIRARVMASRAAADAALVNVPDAALLPADGGWSAILRIGGRHLDSGLDEDGLVTRLLHGPGVVTHPGWFFDLDDVDAAGRRVLHLVVSLLVEPAAMARGIGHVATLLRER